jgi:hypothetical protein
VAKHTVPAALLFLAIGLHAPARADAPVSLGTAGAIERAGLTQDARKNPTAASFGAPVSDDRRLFKLRWRLPWLFAGGSGVVGAAPFGGGFASTGYALPGGVALMAEPMRELSALIPQLEFGERNKLVHLQVGALSFGLGNDTLVDRITNSPDGLSRTLGVMGSINLAGLAGTVAVGDVLDPTSFFAARLQGRPLMWFGAPDATFQPNELDVDPRTEVLGIWVVGATVALDHNAPLRDPLEDPGPCPGPCTGDVTAFGIDNQAALLDNQFVKGIFFLDINGLSTPTELGTGVHPGVRAMADLVWLRLELDVEGYAGTDGYVPRYFDRLYARERTATLGNGKPKAALTRPASYGWQGRAQISLLKSLTLFGEAKNQRPFVDVMGDSNMVATVGASMWLLFFGGAITATQVDMERQPLFGPGFVVTGEARVAVVLNTLHFVGRFWRAHVPAGPTSEQYVADEGFSFGAEVNFDLF